MEKKQTLFESLVGVHALHKKAHNCGKQLKTYDKRKESKQCRGRCSRCCGLSSLTPSLITGWQGSVGS